MSYLDPEVQSYRKLMFEPCKSREHVKNWIHFFLKIDLPDCTVDDESTSNPVDLIWECYSKMVEGTDENFTHVLAYASRDSFKTLSASILEFLSIVHLGRDVAHVAAILQQSKKAQEYIKKYFALPGFRDFLVVENERNAEFAWYVSKRSGAILTPDEFKTVAPQEQHYFEGHVRKIQLLVATKESMNSAHVPFYCLDGDSKVYIKGNDRLRKKTTVKRAFAKHQEGKTVEILSFNFDTGAFEFKSIIGSYVRKAQVFELTVNNKKLIATADHPVLTTRGMIMLKDLTALDRVVYFDKFKSDTILVSGREAPADWIVPNGPPVELFHDVMVGSLLGDGGVYKKTNGNPYFVERHCLAQSDYLDWKISVLSHKIRFTKSKSAVSGYTGEEQIEYRSGQTPYLTQFLDVKLNPSKYVANLSPLALAVWYMDDGCAGNTFRLSTECWSEEENRKMALALNELYGFNLSVCSYDRESSTYFYLSGTVEDKRRLSQICALYIHESMAYKFDVSKNYRNCKACHGVIWKYENNRSLYCTNLVCQGINQGTFKVGTPSIEPLDVRTVYDFTVDGNHNFLSNSFISKNCLDELDLARPEAIEEGKMIPAPTYDGKLPLTFMTSTRKYAFGLVQKEIDKANQDPDYKLQRRHWNIIDVTKACPPERHLPEEPNIYIYYSRENLKAISEDEFKGMNPEEQKKYQRGVGYKGCLQNCKLFPVCRGRLAKHQKSKSPMLRDIKHVTNQFKALNPEMAKAQLMCWKPASTGLIYPRLERDLHLKSADEMFEMISGDKPHKAMNKRDIINLIQEVGGRFYCGLDWGFTHNFAVVTAGKVGNILFVIDVICISGLELSQKLDICEEHIKPLNPTIFPDPEDPASIKTFQKRGFKCVKFTKNVVEGIEAVRSKLAPSMDAPPELFILKGDEQCELLFKHMSQYHFKVDDADQPTKVPDEENDDLPDAIRYLCQNLAGKRGSIQAAKEMLSVGVEEKPKNSHSTWMTEKIEELTNGATDEEMPDSSGKKGNFHWNI